MAGVRYLPKHRNRLLSMAWTCKCRCTVLCDCVGADVHVCVRAWGASTYMSPISGDFEKAVCDMIAECVQIDFEETFPARYFLTEYGMIPIYARQSCAHNMHVTYHSNVTYIKRCTIHAYPRISNCELYLGMALPCPVAQRDTHTLFLHILLYASADNATVTHTTHMLYITL